MTSEKYEPQPGNAQFESLFRFIKKNKTLRNKLNEIADSLEENVAHKRKIAQLKQAVATGSAKDPIFSDDDCVYYLLYLLKTQEISWDEGMTVYGYLMILMQFSEKPSLKPEDAQYKEVTSVTVDRGVDADGKLTPSAKAYLKRVCDSFQSMGLGSIDYNELVSFFIELPPTEQWLTEFTYPDRNVEKGRYNGGLLKAAAASVPLIGINPITIPSFSFINHCLKLISPHGMELQYSFGSGSPESYVDLHKKKIHAASIYNPLVRDNKVEAHNSKRGPIPVWIHDIAHAVWGTSLMEDGLNLIFQDYIPLLESISKECLERTDWCGLIKMSEEPTLENLKKTNKNQYIVANKELWYFDHSKKTLAQLAFSDEPSRHSFLEELHFVKKDHPATVRELTLITSYTGHRQSDRLLKETARREAAQSFCKTLIEQADDLDLSPIYEFRNPGRLEKYMKKIMEASRHHCDQSISSLIRLEDTKFTRWFFSAFINAREQANAEGNVPFYNILDKTIDEFLYMLPVEDKPEEEAIISESEKTESPAITPNSDNLLKAIDPASPAPVNNLQDIDVKQSAEVLPEPSALIPAISDALIKDAISNAYQRYQAFQADYKCGQVTAGAQRGEHDHYGWFTWFRHASIFGDAKKANNFHRCYGNPNHSSLNLECLKQDLLENHTNNHHRHAFATYVLDELATLIHPLNDGEINPLKPSPSGHYSKDTVEQIFKLLDSETQALKHPVF